MKQTILFLAFLALSFSCPAQKSWVSVRINDFNRQHTTTVDPVYDITNKGWLLLPSVGYYRIFDDTWGLGCEFGYAKTTTDQDGITTFPATDNVSLSYVGSRVTQYYVCPSVFDLFTLDRYRLTASLSFPVTYATDMSYDQKGTETTRSNMAVSSTHDVLHTYPNQLSIGIFFNAGVQRKIFKGLYCGPLIAIGFSHFMANGDELETTTQSYPNTITTVTIVTTHAQHNETKLSFVPVFTFNYYF